MHCAMSESENQRKAFHPELCMTNAARKNKNDQSRVI